jgi:hypothetical protein
MRGIAIALLVVLGACGGGADEVDLEGMYQVSYHTEAHSDVASMPVSCAAEGDAQTEPAYIRMIPGFTSGFELEECTSSDPGSCTFTLWTFVEAIDGGWEWTTSSTQVGGGTTCALHHWEQVAVIDDAGELTVTLKEWADFNELPESECTLDAADELSGDPDCKHHERIVAARQ